MRNLINISFTYLFILLLFAVLLGVVFVAFMAFIETIIVIRDLLWMFL